MLRLVKSVNIIFALLISLNWTNNNFIHKNIHPEVDTQWHIIQQTFSAASGLLGFLSGWYFNDNFLNVFLISSGVAVFGISKIAYRESPDVLKIF